MTKPLIRIYFDTETYKTVRKKEIFNVPYLTGYAIEKYSIDSDVDPIGIEYNSVCENDFYKFLDILNKYGHTHRVELIAYNMYYDITVIMPLVRRYMPDWILNSKLDSKRNFVYGKFQKKKRGFNIKLCDYWLWNKQYRLADWIMLLHKKDKMTLDYEKWNAKINGDILSYYTDHSLVKKIVVNTKHEHKYLYEDVMVLADIRKNINEMKKGMFNATNLPKLSIDMFRGLTSSSFGKFCVAKKLNIDFDLVFRPELTFEEYEVLERSYFGGLTFGNKDLHRVSGVEMESWDINGMYVAIMAKGVPAHYMIGNKMNLIGKEDVDWITWYECQTDVRVYTDPNTGFVTEEIDHMRWNKEYRFISASPLPLDLQSGKRFVISKRLYIKLCEMVENPPEVVSVSYQQIDRGIGMYMKEMFALRKDPLLDKMTSQSVKVSSNAVYGKLAEKSHIIEHTYSMEKENYVLSTVEDPIYRSCLGAIYITNTARVMLLDKVTEQVSLGNTVVYCDTDSIKFIRHVPSNMVDSKELGGWGYEGTFKYFSRPANRLKRYVQMSYIDFPGKTKKELEKYCGVACGGFNVPAIKMMTKRDLKTFFAPFNNVLVFGGKVVGANNSIGQKILVNTDIQTNPSFPVSHLLRYVDGKYTLIKNGVEL